MSKVKLSEIEDQALIESLESENAALRLALQYIIDHAKERYWYEDLLKVRHYEQITTIEELHAAIAAAGREESEG